MNKVFHTFKLFIFLYFIADCQYSFGKITNLIKNNNNLISINFCHVDDYLNLGHYFNVQFFSVKMNQY